MTVIYDELLDAQRRAEDAEYEAARARRDRDRFAEALHDAGVPIRSIARALGLTPAAVSQRLSARRRELMYAAPTAARHNENHDTERAHHRCGEGGVN